MKTKRRVKLLLINPPVSIERVYGKFARGGSNAPPLSLCYIAGYLLKYGKDVTILDAARLGLSNLQILDLIAKDKPDVIGFHVCTPHYRSVAQLAKLIKERFPQVLLIAGGPHFYGDPLKDIYRMHLDLIVIGEGEVTVLEVIKALEDNRADELLSGPIKQMEGVIFKHKDAPEQTPPRAPIADIDSIPFPARHLLPPLQTYRMSDANYRRYPATTMLTSRGCPFSCVFCVNSLHKERVRQHSLDYVTGEVDELIFRYGIRDIYFIDDVLTINKERTLQLCEALEKRKKKLTWSCNIKVGLVDRNQLFRMKKAGCWMVMVGVESGNQEIVNAIGKRFRLEDARELCLWCKEAGLMVHPNFIIGHPGETEKSINETISFARKLFSHYPLFTLMTPFPGTQLWNTASRFGTLNVDNFEYFTLGSENPRFIPYNLSKELLIKKRDEAYRACYLQWPMICRHLQSLRSLEDLRRFYRASRILLDLAKKK